MWKQATFQQPLNSSAVRMHFYHHISQRHCQFWQQQNTAWQSASNYCRLKALSTILLELDMTNKAMIHNWITARISERQWTCCWEEQLNRSSTKPKGKRNWRRLCRQDKRNQSENKRTLSQRKPCRRYSCCRSNTLLPSYFIILMNLKGTWLGAVGEASPSPDLALCSHHQSPTLVTTSGQYVAA